MNIHSIKLRPPKASNAVLLSAPAMLPSPPASHTKPAYHDYHQCLTVSRAAKLLDVSTTTIRRMIHNGRLQGLRNGRLVRVFQWSLDWYLMQNTIAPESTIEPSASKPKRAIRSTGHQVAMRELERLGL